MSNRQSPSKAPAAFAYDGRKRVVIDAVRPQIDSGTYAVKRVVGDLFAVEADLLVDGHDIICGAVLYRFAGGGDPTPSVYHDVALTPLGNDAFRGTFMLNQVGRYHYTVEGWIDAFATWRRGVQRKLDANQGIESERLSGAQLIEETIRRVDVGRQASGAHDARILSEIATALRAGDTEVPRALDETTAEMMARYPDRGHATRYARTLEVVVDPPRARFSAWYEMFPRSCGAPGMHGTFADVEARLAYVAELGFDVLYLPPIHPIGVTHRKGRNNDLSAGPSDPGSPWAIGAPIPDATFGADFGGHKSVHPMLGTLADFDRLVDKARALGIEIALDIAFQASPDHPYVKAHPEWFVHRPDGTIQYAENPPKKYQDVYPFAFDGEAFQPLWEELKSVFTFWLSHGVRTFRVDNPHTKPLPFWEWCLREVKALEPNAIFLAEAFTRPKMMYGLAKRGFTQSYTYFTWRSTKAELTDYLTELTKSDVIEHFRPNFWPNTPDILPEDLQHGGRAAFLTRLVLAATLSSNYGIYGPAFETMEHLPRAGSEEYLNSEKFELKWWDPQSTGSLRDVIRRLNTIRKDNPALQAMRHLAFHKTDNELMLAYSKRTDDASNIVLVVVNLDVHHAHATWLDLDLSDLGIKADETFQVHDLIGEARYHWKGPRNYVRLDPTVMPAHVFRIRRFARSEMNFEYYL
ncbi:MAG: alpha-1,4-glucan--maltose-1-phosphate maltosyltransferase [Polyangiales bacterium]